MIYRTPSLVVVNMILGLFPMSVNVSGTVSLVVINMILGLLPIGLNDVQDYFPCRCITSTAPSDIHALHQYLGT